MGIKSFIYLDEYKMYSISSQIFEGLTEYVINSSSHKEKKSESQSGPFGSGRILADIISTDADSQEKKFLHDYSYTLFETKLLTDDAVVRINEASIDQELQKLNEKHFVKVTGRVMFNDVALINNTLTHFNELGAALTYVTNLEKIIALKAKLKDLEIGAQPKGNSKKSGNTLLEKMQQELDKEIENLAEKANLRQDQEYMDKLAYLLDFGFHNQFEIQLQIASKNGKRTFSANLDRQYLKEDENLLIRKHARYTERDFTVFGIITQSGARSTVPDELKQEIDESKLKGSLLNIVISLLGVETSFTGRLPNEIIIDPIAVYREL